LQQSAQPGKSEGTASLCMYMNIYIYIYVHQYMYTFTVFIYTLIHTYIHTCIYTYIQQELLRQSAQLRKSEGTALLCMYMNTYIYIHLHQYIYTYNVFIYAHIHTYIHTCIYTYMPQELLRQSAQLGKSEGTASLCFADRLPDISVDDKLQDVRALLAQCA